MPFYFKISGLNSRGQVQFWVI